MLHQRTLPLTPLVVLIAAAFIAVGCGDDSAPADSATPDSGPTDSGADMDSGADDSAVAMDSGMADSDAPDAAFDAAFDAAMDAAADASLPNSTVVSKLLASDGAASDFFGTSIAIDGDTVIVGSHFHDGQAGAAYVFVRSGDTWTEEARLQPADSAAQDYFGDSVALHGDTAIIGAPGDDTGGASAGSAYVFVRSGTTWSQQSKLSASDPRTLNRFGFAVAISGDTALVGAFANDNNGAAYTFERTGTSWSAASKLVHDGPTNGRFGIAVALDGDTAIVGASAARRAYIYSRGATSWDQVTTLQSATAASREGNSVDIEGDTAIVGSPAETNTNGSRAGAAYVYVRSGATWSEEQQLLGDVATGGDNFGSAVALAGERAVVGAVGNDTVADNAGAAYLLERTGTAWATTTTLTASDGTASAFYGFSASFSGNFMAIGASGADAAYIVPLGSL